jgi:universal stress protein A
MPAWTRICCPVDFSVVSRFAMEQAAELAWRSGGELTLVHVYERRPRPVVTDTLVSAPELLDQAPVELERELTSWRDAARRLASRPVDCSFLAGEPISEIVRFAREGSYDLIVMGTHGRAELEHAVFGSVAEKVVREAPCSVLVVRPHPSRAAERLPPGGP